jgi:hypothetical protein
MIGVNASVNRSSRLLNHLLVVQMRYWVDPLVEHANVFTSVKLV